MSNSAIASPSKTGASGTTGASDQTLSAAARAALVKAVGKRHLGTDASILCCHAWNNGVGGLFPTPDPFAKHWPIAVVLPGSTEEVAAVVRACNEHGLKFKAHSTGYGAQSLVPEPNTVSIDLRRMNDVRIDARNRMAVIGPYVTAGQLQAEAFKHGLTCHVVGAGPVHSPLASATSMMGIGVTSNSTSNNVRNLLSWEWVTPQGEVVRSGSSIEGDEWFAGDGPGPGVRGMLRGILGALGAMGVFTRIGYKLYPWSGPAEPVVSGPLPQLGLEIPALHGMHHAVWDDWESQRDATAELTSAGVAFALLRVPAIHQAWLLSPTNADYLAMQAQGCLPTAAQSEHDKNWVILTTSYSEGEKAWKDGVVHDVLQRTSGRLIDMKESDRQLLYRNVVTSQYVSRGFRLVSGLSTSMGLLESIQCLPKAIAHGAEVLGKEVQPGGRLLQSGPECYWLWTHENRYIWGENIISFDASKESSREAAAFALFKSFQVQFRDPVGPLALVGGPVLDLQGKSVGAPQDYLRAFKNAIDPGNHSVSVEYVSPPLPKLLSKVLPKIPRLVLSDPMLRLISKKIAKSGL